jgi:hypothetical protein
MLGMLIILCIRGLVQHAGAHTLFIFSFLCKMRHSEHRTLKKNYSHCLGSH